MGRTNAAAEIHSPLYSPGTQAPVVMRHCGRFSTVSKTVVGLWSTEGSNPSPSAEPGAQASCAGVGAGLLLLRSIVLLDPETLAPGFALSPGQGRVRRLAAAALLGLLVATASACGGDDDSGDQPAAAPAVEAGDPATDKLGQ